MRSQRHRGRVDSRGTSGLRRRHATAPRGGGGLDTAAGCLATHPRHPRLPRRRQFSRAVDSPAVPRIAAGRPPVCPHLRLAGPWRLAGPGWRSRHRAATPKAPLTWEGRPRKLRGTVGPPGRTLRSRTSTPGVGQDLPRVGPVLMLSCCLPASRASSRPPARHSPRPRPARFTAHGSPLCQWGCGGGGGGGSESRGLGVAAGGDRRRQ